MLSKLRYFQNEPASELADCRASINLEAVLRRLGAGGVQGVDGGTLGAGFLVWVNGRRRFLKTHVVPEGRETLDKELAILSCLYGKSIHLERIEIACTDACQLWLLMDELVYSPIDFDINQVLVLVDGYSQRLKHCAGTLRISSNDNFPCLLGEGRKALRNLAHRGLLSGSVQEKIRPCFSLLEQQVDCFAPFLCHGDFGPKNLMFDGKTPVVIDWEDAFWGIEGYDYLFWLTFFDNRKYYSQKIFGKTPWGKEIEIAILILIVVLKSELSFRSNRYKENKLTFDERIVEILNLG